MGGYIALAGLWGSPISGTSMNPARTFGPDLVGVDFSALLGVRRRADRRAPRLAVGVAFVLRGRAAAGPAPAPRRGALDTEVARPGKA